MSTTYAHGDHLIGNIFSHEVLILHFLYSEPKNFVIKQNYRNS